MRFLVIGVVLSFVLAVPAAAQDPPPADPARIAALIARLGDAQFQAREEASAALRELGGAALDALRAACASDDAEIASRARLLVRAIEVDLTPTPWACRQRRAALAAEHGGTDRTEAAIDAGLAWLARHQDEDGRWDARGFAKHDAAGAPSTGAAKLEWVDPGVTGLALLAFLGADHSHRQGTHKEVVKNALKFLLKVQTADGRIGGDEGHYLYNHGIGTLALVDAYGVTKSPLLKDPATRALAYLVAARNPAKAWRYGSRDGDNDISVTSWAVAALHLGRLAELEVDGADQALRDARAYVGEITVEGGPIAGYKSRPPRGWTGPTSARFQSDEIGVNTANTHKANHTPTAIAAMCRLWCGGVPPRAEWNDVAAALAAIPPAWPDAVGAEPSPADLYYWYYASLAMFQAGGEAWTTWNAAVIRTLLTRQATTGSEAGSWPTDDAWGFAGGRVQTTALAVLILQTYYRYPRAR